MFKVFDDGVDFCYQSFGNDSNKTDNIFSLVELVHKCDRLSGVTNKRCSADQQEINQQQFQKLILKSLLFPFFSVRIHLSLSDL